MVVVVEQIDPVGRLAVDGIQLAAVADLVGRGHEVPGGGPPIAQFADGRDRVATRRSDGDGAKRGAVTKWGNMSVKEGSYPRSSKAMAVGIETPLFIGTCGGAVGAARS